MEVRLKLTSIGGINNYVLPYLPNWGDGMSATFSFDSDATNSVAWREERRPVGSTLRVRLDYNYVLEAPELAEFRNALRVIQDTPVRVPFWPSVDTVAGPWGAKWWLGFTESGTAGAVESLSWSTTAATQRVPSLLGYLSADPTFTAINPKAARVAVSFQESSAADEALTVSSYAWTAGPAAASITRYLFPWRANWTREVDLGAVRVDVRRNQFGFSRQADSEAYPQVGFKLPKFTLTLQDSDAPRLVRWWYDRKGSVEPFWLPLELQECALASDTSSGSVDITLTDAGPIADFSFIGLITEGGEVLTRKIVSRVGNVLTLDASPGNYGAAELGVCVLALVRHAGGDLTVNWKGAYAEATLAFQECSAEYGTPSGETVQTTLGDLPAKAFVYDITHGTDVLRATTWDVAITEPVSLNSYSPANMDHGDISETSALEDSSTSLRFRYNAANPITKLLLNNSTERIQVKIREVRPASPWTNEATIFTGYVTRCAIDGAFVNAEVKSTGNLMARRVPRILLQVSDNATLFDAANRLNIADWTFSARLTAVSGTDLTFDTITWPGGALPTIGADYFALGYLARPTGTDFDRISIVASTAISGGSVTVTLARALSTTPSLPQTGWSLFPGYDGYIDTADTKFSNRTNFLGFPFVPATNPSIVPAKKEAASAGKK